MLDIKLVRANPEMLQEICKNRRVDVDVSKIVDLDRVKRELQHGLESLRSEANENAKNNAVEKSVSIARGKELKQKSLNLEKQLSEVELELESQLLLLPNTYADDTPIGMDDESNVEVTKYSAPPAFDFEPKDHLFLANKLGMDFEAGVKTSGSGFPILKGTIAKLETALMRFVMDRAEAAGFTQVNIPLMVKQEIMQGAGFNPRRTETASELFPLMHDNLFMIGTAEVPLVGQFSNEILARSELPIKVFSMSPCFRREGASGRRDAGLYRNKTFTKVELVALVEPEQSEKTLEEILNFEIGIFESLGIHFRVIRICSGDLGAPAYKKYDLEAWMLGRDRTGGWGWGELTSCSNCTDFQARRLQVRYKSEHGKNVHVHTLNGTGITTRAIIPLLEQYQQADNSIKVPAVLQPYLKTDVLQG
ncbi:serine--tRNA ligase [Pseudomonas sp. UBA6562]|uniref:serine--tRNA ligase n=1 Tax=Pseudomonas sp. UBA6562 TaxID=1947332 RepID=UPI0025CBC27B|nr:serine--tRNA ligase [Pseudomonas sp. UBA6562]